MESWLMVFLDTNAVIWLYQAELNRFSDEVKLIMESNDLVISPLVKLELKYLFEVQRVNQKPDRIIGGLYDSIGLQLHNVPLTALIEQSLYETWTRDPFDRLITAHARLEKKGLITKDETILNHYSKAIW